MAGCVVRSFIPGTPYQSSLILNNQGSTTDSHYHRDKHVFGYPARDTVTGSSSHSPVDLLSVRLLFKVEMGGDGKSKGGKISGSDHHHQAQSHQLLILMKGDDFQANILYQEPAEQRM